jgi:hypothetical protein
VLALFTTRLVEVALAEHLIGCRVIVSVGDVFAHRWRERAVDNESVRLAGETLNAPELGDSRTVLRLLPRWRPMIRLTGDHVALLNELADMTSRADPETRIQVLPSLFTEDPL